MSEKMSPAEQASVLAQIAELLDEPSVELRIESGFRHWPNYKTGHMEAAPTKGRTVTIKIHGGARHETKAMPPCEAQAEMSTGVYQCDLRVGHEEPHRNTTGDVTVTW